MTKFSSLTAWSRKLVVDGAPISVHGVGSGFPVLSYLLHTPAVQSESLVGNFTTSQLMEWFPFVAWSIGEVDTTEKHVCSVLGQLQGLSVRIGKNLLACTWYYQHIPTSIYFVTKNRDTISRPCCICRINTELNLISTQLTDYHG